METSFEFKKPVQTGAILKELDVCRSLFESLSYQLENNAGIKDFHGLAVLASEGVRKADLICDMLDQS